MTEAIPSKMEQRSVQTRAQVVQAAYRLFCANGYRATTMDAIGEAAGVSVQTVYFQFRSKAAVLEAVHEWTVLGDDPLPPPLQPWHVAAMAEPDARDALARIVAGCAALNSRVAPMLPVFDSLAQEPGGEIYRRAKEWRRRDLRALVDALRAKTPLLPGLTPGRAADLLYFLSGPESYAELVLEASWPRRRWIEWVTHTLTGQFFGAETA